MKLKDPAASHLPGSVLDEVRREDQLHGGIVLWVVAGCDETFFGSFLLCAILSRQQAGERLILVTPKRVT